MTTAAPAIVPAPDLPTAPPPRKRRRRTATSGAADDCFTCRKRAVPCDRKRPYCTPCIDIGKECSGYKTTLTWGVGVASRGKLRGLSCPVANKNGEVNNTSPNPLAIRRRKSSVHHRDGEGLETVSAAGNSRPQLNIPDPPATAPRPHGSTVYSPLTPISVSSPQQGWPMPPAPRVPAAYPAPGARKPSFGEPPLQRLQTTFAAPYDPRAAPQSATSMASFPETEYQSPLEIPPTPGSSSLGEKIQTPLSTTYNPQPMMTNPNGNMNLYAAVSPIPYSDMLNPNIDALSASSAPFSGHSLPSPDTGLNGFGMGLLGHGDALLSPFGNEHYGYDAYGNPTHGYPEDDTDFGSKGLGLMDTRFSNPFYHMSPRMQHLLEYYDRNVCPVIVAFDGPENPYRRHILQLSMQSEGLQNAIAALATNNYRMRQQPLPKRIGHVEEIPDSLDGTRSNSASEPTQEESYYRQMSIHQLNMQLADPLAAQDDSVFATLLILCLFHVCDSGFSQFKTQLAGVQKLLSMRGPIGQSDFTRWVEMFFIWFDVMTSTVNDREMQIKPESLDMLDFSANMGALEQFSGCDGRLFKLIARLGRLNLLSQGRPVRQQDGVGRNPKPVQRKREMSKRPFAAHDFDNFDGNGWGAPIITSDEDLDGVTDGHGSFHHTNHMMVPDSRSDFLNEWHDIRSRLQAWEMDPGSTPASLSSLGGMQAETGHLEFVHINESFRYSALLYTERLGNPFLPSSHPNFQQYVSQALHHIRALPVTSCVNKFLLWPLFIAGTECVDSADRAFVRDRCVEIQKESGFYNNLSSLEVLERVWQDSGNEYHHRHFGSVYRREPGGFGGPAATGVPKSTIPTPIHPGHMPVANLPDEESVRRRDSEAARTGLYGPAFRWRKAMDRVDGEYIVI